MAWWTDGRKIFFRNPKRCVEGLRYTREGRRCFYRYLCKVRYVPLRYRTVNNTVMMQDGDFHGIALSTYTTTYYGIVGVFMSDCNCIIVKFQVTNIK